MRLSVGALVILSLSACSTELVAPFINVDGGGADSHSVKDGEPPETWAIAVGAGDGESRARAIAVDGSGDIWFAGKYSEAATLGTVELVTSPYHADRVFLGKISPAKDLYWANSVGPTYKPNLQESFYSETINGIVFIEEGALFVGTSGASYAKYGSIPYARSAGEAYCLSVSSAGEPVELFSIEGSGGRNSGNDITSTPDGDIVYVGTYRGSENKIGQIELPDSGNDADLFVVKASPSGDVRWTVWGASSFYDGAYDVATNVHGEIYVLGAFQSHAKFGSIELEGSQEKEARAHFIAKLSADGHYLWAIATLDVAWLDAKVDHAGDLWLVGTVYDTAKLGDNTLGKDGEVGGVVAKVSPGGNFLWARVMASARIPEISDPTYHPMFESIAVDKRGRVFLTGSLPPSTSLLDVAYSSDYRALVVEVSSQGEAIWAAAASGPGQSHGAEIALDGLGHAYVAGGFEDKVKLGQTELVSEGKGDGFVWKLPLRLVPEF
jgi:hypothetical protein